MFEFVRSFKRYFAMLCIMFILGIYVSQGSSIADNLIIRCALLSLALPLFVFISYVIIKRLNFVIRNLDSQFIISTSAKITLLLMLSIIFFTIGIFRMSTAEKSQTEKAELFADKSYFVKMMVTSEPKLNSKQTSVAFNGKLVSYIDTRNTIDAKDLDVNIQMYSSYIGALKLNVGDVIEFYCDFSIPDSTDEYGDFDYNLYLRQKEISLIGTCKYLRLTEEPYEYSLKDKFLMIGAGLRNSICKAIDESFGYSVEHVSLIKSILTGDKGNMPEDLQDAMAKSGISHIAAVSGMHVSILFSAISAILGIAGFRKELVLLISIPILILFMAVASFSPSVMRAVITLIIFIIAYLIERDHDPITALFIAAFVIIIINPYTLFSVSFLLSFGSSLAILVFSPLIKEELSGIARIPLAGRLIADSFAVTISSFLGTVYFSLYFFNYIVFSSLVVNLWVILLVPIIFGVGYLVWLIGLIMPELAVNFLRYFAVLPLEVIIRTAYFFKEIPVLYPYMKLPSRFQFISYLAVMLFLFLLLRYRKENRDLAKVEEEC